MWTQVFHKGNLPLLHSRNSCIEINSSDYILSALDITLLNFVELRLCVCNVCKDNICDATPSPTPRYHPENKKRDIIFSVPFCPEKIDIVLIRISSVYYSAMKFLELSFFDYYFFFYYFFFLNCKIHQYRIEYNNIITYKTSYNLYSKVQLNLLAIFSNI